MTTITFICVRCERSATEKDPQCAPGRTPVCDACAHGADWSAFPPLRRWSTFGVHTLFRSTHGRWLKDPWGTDLFCDRIDDVVKVTAVEGLRQPYHNGYTHELGQVYATEDGDTCYAQAPTDYCGSTRYVWLSGRRSVDGVGAYKAPSPHARGRLLLDGVAVAWDGEKFVSLKENARA